MFEKVKTTRFMQYMAALSASACVTSYTMYSTWPSPILPLLTSAESPLERPLSDEEASWVTSSFILAGIPAAFVMPQIINKCGRRKVLLGAGVSLIIPWLIIIFAKNIVALYVARAIGGASNGFISTCVSLYNGEVADEDIRGKLATSYAFMKLIGSFIILAAGPFLSYTSLAIICGLIPILFISVFFFMPESPHDLVKNNDIDGARKVLKQLAGTCNETHIKRKLNDIEGFIQAEMDTKESFYTFFTEKKFRKVILIALGVKTLQLFSGGVAVEAYMQTIIESSSSIISPEISSIIFGFIQFPSVIVSSIMVDKFGRRPLLMTAAIGTAIALFAEGLYFFLEDYLQTDTSAISWLPTTGIVGFIVFYNLGLLPLPYILFGELFPSNIKSTAVSLMATYGLILNFAVVKSFSPMSNALGMYTAFWFFAVCCILGTIFTYFALPETKGRTFQEIQADIKSAKQ